MSSIYDFIAIIHQRINVKRKYYNQALRQYGIAIAGFFALESKENKLYKCILDDNINTILNDCEIYFNMEKEKASDAMQELSNYASIYADNFNDSTYIRIADLIKQIRNSYNFSNFANFEKNI